MKKKLIIFFLVGLFILSGCGKQDPTVEEYQKLVAYLKKETEFATPSSRYQTELSFSKVTEEEIQYRFVLDEVEEPIKNTMSLLIHDQESTDIFPSVGIFDEKVDLEVEKSPKGIILVGYIPFSGEISDFQAEFRIYLSYTLEDGTSYQECYRYQK